MKAEEEAELTFAGAQPYSREAYTMEIDGEVFEGELWSFRSGTGCAANAGTLCGTDYDERLDVFVFVEPDEYQMELAFDRDPDTYVPVRDDLVEVSVTLDPAPPPGSTVTFDLTHHDYGDGSGQFAFDSGSTSKTVEVEGSEARATLRSPDYWGVFEVKATVDAEPEGCGADAQFPTDTDRDGIADSWELHPDNGGTLALGGTDQDANWDEETSLGNENDGDNFTKLGEYQGVMIGQEHVRLDPTKKEVFFDIRESEAGAYAISQVEAQLDIKTYVVDGLFRQQNAGTNALKWLGVNAEESSIPGLPRLGRGFVQVVDKGLFYDSPASGLGLLRNGIIVQNGVYPVDGSSAKEGDLQPEAVQGGPGLGETSFEAGHPQGAIVWIYDKVVDNLWSNNSIPEDVQHTFAFRVAVPSEDEGGFGEWESGFGVWNAIYSNEDLNENNVVDDLINPLDVLSGETANNPVDGVIAGVTRQAYLRRVTLHEIGHALSMWEQDDCVNRDRLADCHPITGHSVMRQGFGPGRSDSFTAEDIAEMNLKGD